MITHPLHGIDDGLVFFREDNNPSGSIIVVHLGKIVKLKINRYDMGKGHLLYLEFHPSRVKNKFIPRVCMALACRSASTSDSAEFDSTVPGYFR